MKFFLKKIRHFFRMFSISFHEMHKNIKYTGFYSENYDKNRWRLILLAHSLEKGLTVTNERVDFGKQKAIDLLKIINAFRKNEFRNTYEYKEAISVLKKYKDFRVQKGLDVEFLKDFDVTNYDEIIDAGEKTIVIEDVTSNNDSFVELCKKRHSIREYNSSYVEINKILNSIDIARYAPSACNRQMIKVFFTGNEEDNKKISSFIPGNNGSKKEKAIYLAICADISAFDYFEVNQWYLNAGIFTGFLTLALTNNNVANCIYQWPMNYKHDEDLRSILKIPNSYEICNIISAGNYKDEFRIATSTRRQVNEYYEQIDNS